MGQVVIVYSPGSKMPEDQGDSVIRRLDREAPPTLDEVQEWVDGLIEFAAEGKNAEGKPVQVLCNEEFLMRDDMEYNHVGWCWANEIRGHEGDPLFGPLVFLIGDDVQMD